MKSAVHGSRARWIIGDEEADRLSEYNRQYHLEHRGKGGPKKRGRPLGSKNKPKVLEVEEEVQEEEAEGKNEVRITLLEKQLLFVQDLSPHILYVGGVGSGKTLAGACKSLKFCGEYPGILGIVTAPSYKVLDDATIPTYEKIFPDGFYNINKQKYRMSLLNGSTILFRSTDDPKLLEGPTAGFYHMDEGAKSPRAAFENLGDRLRQPDTPMCGWVTTTPDGYNWVYTEFAAKRRPNYVIYEARTRDNVFLPQSYIERREEEYAGQEQKYLQQLEGKFVLIGGSCYFPMDALQDMIDDCTFSHKKEDEVVKIYKPPVVGRRYIAGADVAEGKGSDRSVLTIFDWQTLEMMASISGDLAPDEFVDLSNKLCRRYGNAILGIESNGPGSLVIDKLVNMHYPRLWKRDKRDYGWLTNVKTRPIMLAELKELLRERAIRIPEKEAIDELISFIINDKGRMEAATGAHDDWVFAIAIAMQMRKYTYMETIGGGPVAFK